MGLSLLIIIPPILVHVFIPKVLIFSCCNIIVLIISELTAFEMTYADSLHSLIWGGGLLFLGVLPNECSNLEVFAQYIYLALSNQSIDRLL